MITEISDAVGESGRGFGRITASEVFRAEVLVASTITQHVIDGCQDRRGNRDRCLLGAVARFETEELGLEIAVLLARCAPRSCTSTGLNQGAPFLIRIERRLPTLSSRARNESRPGEKMAGARELTHVDPDLGDHGLNGGRTKPRHLLQPLHNVVKGRQRGLNAGVEGCDAVLQLLNRP